jgi:hypothetical protein
MRFYEIQNLPVYDVTNALIGDMHRLLETCKSKIFENNSDTLTYKQFIHNQKLLLDTNPIVGNSYAPIGLNASPIQQAVSIQQPPGPMEFVKTIPGRRFQFLYQNKLIIYPKASDTTIDLGEMLMDTLLYTSMSDANQFITLFTLKFGDWTIYKR